MTGTTKPTFKVVQANGETVDVQADRAVEEGGRLALFVGDEQVAGFVGHRSFYKV